VTDIVISAEALGKKYLIGHQAGTERYIALRDVIARGARGLVRSAADMVRGRPIIAGDAVEEFWALKDVSFEVKRREVVGIIGRNGAGKSTLLKILSRITEPSAGRVTIRGRVASLLEVGTGFHPELTGRENIYLNGAILGMTRAEIRRKFDEIVAFAEVEKFLDTPVKRYSSGMYVRLAFAVAAHLDPEILVVDEVLAVGDAEFQRKCLGKMGEVARGGRTVLFVSHNMVAIRTLCDSILSLKSGRMIGRFTNVTEGISSYHDDGPKTKATWQNSQIGFQNNYVIPVSLSVSQSGPASHGMIDIDFVADILKVHPQLNIALFVRTLDDQIVLSSSCRDDNAALPVQDGRQRFTCKVPAALLNNITYKFEVIALLHNIESLWSLGSGPQVEWSIPLKEGVSQFWGSHRIGVVAPVLEWTTVPYECRAQYSQASARLT
jgi:lipopolysaccharide transport system ATP-binding protein